MGGNIVAMTGATGFIGQAVLPMLVEAGWHIRALTRRPQDTREGVTWIDGALDNPESLLQLCDGANAILHIAGVVNAPGKEGFEVGNVAGTQNILDAAKIEGVKRFLHVSSLSAKQPQLSDYGGSKFRAEKLVGTSMLDWTTPPRRLWPRRYRDAGPVPHGPARRCDHAATGPRVIHPCCGSGRVTGGAAACA